MLRKLIALFVLSSGIALAGCNTIEGAGRDIESVGNKVADAAD